jgi:hypothetical protein
VSIADRDLAIGQGPASAKFVPVSNAAAALGVTAVVFPGTKKIGNAQLMRHVEMFVERGKKLQALRNIPSGNRFRTRRARGFHRRRALGESKCD